MSLANIPAPETAFQTMMHLLAQASPPVTCEKRILSRTPFMTAIRVQPCDDHMVPVAESFEALTRDICHSGIGFFSTELIESDHVSIEFMEYERETETIYAEIVHQSPRGPLYLLGCKVLVDWAAE